MVLGVRAESPSDLLERVRELDHGDERRAALARILGRLGDVAPLLRLLRSEAERSWTIDPRVSLRCADALIDAARLVGERSQLALGLMTRADSLRFLGRYPESVAPFEAAARLYLAFGDEVGWA